MEKDSKSFNNFKNQSLKEKDLHYCTLLAPNSTKTHKAINLYLDLTLEWPSLKQQQQQPTKKTNPYEDAGTYECLQVLVQSLQKRDFPKPQTRTILSKSPFQKINLNESKPAYHTDIYMSMFLAIFFTKGTMLNQPRCLSNEQ